MPGPTSSNKRGTRSICTGKARSWRSSTSSSSTGSLENAMITRSTSRLLTTSASRSGSAEDGQVFGQVAAPGLRLPIDESDDVQSILRVLDQLAGDQLTDLAGAQDQRVLDVGAGPPAQATRHGPHEGQGADRERPEGDQRIDAGVGRARPGARQTSSTHTPIVTR